MERKIVSGIMLTLLLMSVLGMAIHVVPVFAEDPIEVGAEHPAQAIWVEPDLIEGIPINDTFTVDVMVNITDPDPLHSPPDGLFGFDYHFIWDATIIDLASYTKHVPAEWTDYFTVKDIVDDYNATHKQHWYGVSALAPSTAFTGVMSLCTYTFNVTDIGSCGLDLQETKLADDLGDPIVHITYDGYFSNLLPPLATAVYFNLNPNPATVGQKVTLKGILVDEFSQSLSNEAVKLYARPLAGSWKYITSLTTNEYGIFTWQATIPAGVTGTYTFAAYYPGSEAYESTYNLAILIIQPPSLFTTLSKLQTMVFFNINPNPVTVGQTLTFKGILVDQFSQSLSNESVKLYARPLAGSWMYVTSLTTNGYGIFMWQVIIPSGVAGTYEFAVYYPGSAAYEWTYNLAILIIQ